MDEIIYTISTSCIGKETAEKLKKELEDKTGYEFKLKVQQSNSKGKCESCLSFVLRECVNLDVPEDFKAMITVLSCKYYRLRVK